MTKKTQAHKCVFLAKRGITYLQAIELSQQNNQSPNLMLDNRSFFLGCVVQVNGFIVDRFGRREH